MNILDGQTAWVTGGGSGVGMAIALMLADAGARVFVSGRTQSALDKVADMRRSISPVVCNVTDRGQVDRCCEMIIEQAKQLDIVIANAGIASSAPFKDLDENSLRDLWDVNVLGVFNCWQAALPNVRQVQHGRLITIASVAGLKGYPYVSGYCSAKHAVLGMMRSVALELASTSVTANAICPGYVDTPMLDRTISNITEKTGCTAEQAKATLLASNPQKRFVSTTEVASTVLWLCHPESQSITGQSLSVSGGEV